MKNEKFVWEEIIDDPARRAAADRRAEEAAEKDAGKEAFLGSFYEKRQRHRKEQTQIRAFRYSCAALAAGLVAYFVGHGGIGGLAWFLAAVAAIMAMIAAYGFGKVAEMG